MRLALVQSGPSLPSVDRQLRSLQSLHPDGYHIEETGAGAAGLRVLEHLERLDRGDELCLARLGVLRMGFGEIANALSLLLGRGVVIFTFDSADALFRIGQTSLAAEILHLLAEVQDGARAAGAVRKAPPSGPSGQRMLTDEQVVDIHRLARAGLSARRIGLIYRRSPACIHALLRQDRTRTVIVSQEPQSNTDLQHLAVR